VVLCGCTKPESPESGTPGSEVRTARRSKTAQPATPDAKLAVAVKAKFAATPELKNENIQVEVKDAGVILNGTVSSDAVRIKAEDTARDVPDVYRVDAEKLIAK
jgi:osmotically-inducible protein OsmY